jgi:hypothetical protein
MNIVRNCVFITTNSTTTTTTTGQRKDAPVHAMKAYEGREV